MCSLLTRPYVRGLLAGGTAALAYFVMPSAVTEESRLLVAWNVGAIFMLVALFIMMSRSNAQQTFERSQQEEASHRLSLLVVVLLAVVGLVGTGTMLDNTKAMSSVQTYVHLTLSMATVITSFALVHVYYALYYARLYYDETADEGQKFAKGLEFPEQELVDYWDFIYYSVTIAICYQTSDVTITSAVMRRLTVVHSLVSFFFVTVTIGLVVSIVSNLM